MTGKNAHPVYQTIKQQYGGRAINDNFEKFLIVDGRVVKRYPSVVNPVDMREDIQAALDDEPVKKSLRMQIHSKRSSDGQPSASELAPWDKLNNPSKEELKAADPSGGRMVFGDDLYKPHGDELDEHDYLENELNRAQKENEKMFTEAKASGEMTEDEIAKHRAAMKLKREELMNEKRENDRKREAEAAAETEEAAIEQHEEEQRAMAEEML